jgi:drug/metabolite transporter (DMT)-like permease
MASVVVAAFFWALGSVVGLKWHSDLSPYMSTALMLMMGGLMFGALGTATGEVSVLRLSQVSLTSVLATLYLAIFGSVVSLTAYVWLLRRCPPHKVATYAFINPVVAIVLGCVLAGEALTQNSAIAMVLIVVSTALLVMKKGDDVQPEPVDEETDASLSPEPALQTS